MTLSSKNCQTETGSSANRVAVSKDDVVGVLLINLGTPDAPTFWAVRRYLKEFLSDPKVIDLPRIIWLPLLYGVILTLRPLRSAKLYQKIWRPEGSPLLVESQKLALKLQQAMGERVHIQLAMRYGEPSIRDGLQQLRKLSIKKIVVLPLYPQYSETTTGTTLIEVKRLLTPGSFANRSANSKDDIIFIKNYADFPPYIEAMRDKIERYWQENGRAQKLLLSFHGLPVRYVENGDPYLEQCQKTAKLLVKALNLKEDEWCMSFQSRVGVEKWLKPYTIELVQSLAQSGIQTLQVFCPGFAVDCLETLEEIMIQNKAVFLDNGGRDFAYISALNDEPSHVKVLSRLIDNSLTP